MENARASGRFYLLPFSKRVVEMAKLAQPIPATVDQTAKGLPPKDLDERLNRIEKLAKQLRSEISH